MKPVLRGIFLTSENPAQTAAFYRNVARVELEQIGEAGGYVYWMLDRDGVQIAIHGASQFADYTHPAVTASNVTHLYFKVESQERFLTHLATLNIVPSAVDEVVVTVSDPDGRRVMFGTA